MLKREFFLAAMRAEAFRHKEWVISAFSIVISGAGDIEKDLYPYKLIVKEDGYYFIDPTNANALQKITDCKSGEPAFKFLDAFDLAKGELENADRDVVTTYGNVLFNQTCLVWPFGAKLPFMTGQLNGRKIEGLLEDRLTDDPEDLDAENPDYSKLDPKKIYVFEYLKFKEAIFAIGGYTQLCVPSASERTMQPAPGVYALRDKLLKENADNLTDPVTIARIDAELIAFDRESFKDDPAAGFLTNKAYDVVRKKLYSMHGGEVGFGDGEEMTLITNSLAEGWDIQKLPQMSNSLREGSYNRGAMTALGGAAVKFFYRIMQNSLISIPDCGSKNGMPHTLTAQELEGFVGFYAVTPTTPVLITKENYAGFAGKPFLMRSPMFCKAKFTDYCEVCMGVKNAESPNGLGAATAEVGSTFMGLFMGAMHGKALKLAKYDYKRAIS